MSKASLAQLACKIGVLSVCAGIVFSGDHPPAAAQQRSANQGFAVISSEDAVQDSDIISINKHMDATDGNVQRQWAVMQATSERQGVAIQALQQALSGMQGEERGLGVVLGLLTSGSIFFQVKGKRVA